MAPLKLYRIAGWSYAVAVALFAIALVSGTYSGEISSSHLGLGVLLFALPCSLFAYALLRRFPQPRVLPLSVLVVMGCYTGVVIFYSFEIGLLLAVPLVLAAVATERDKRIAPAGSDRGRRGPETSGPPVEVRE